MESTFLLWQTRNDNNISSILSPASLVSWMSAWIFHNFFHNVFLFFSVLLLYFILLIFGTVVYVRLLKTDENLYYSVASCWLTVGGDINYSREWCLMRAVSVSQRAYIWKAHQYDWKHKSHSDVWVALCKLVFQQSNLASDVFGYSTELWPHFSAVDNSTCGFFFFFRCSEVKLQTSA